MSHDKRIDLTVSYAPAGDKLVDNNAKRNETLAALHSRVLDAFGLKEKDGEKIRRFVFFHDDTELTDLEKTLGDIAGERDNLHLQLAKERYFFIYAGTGQKILSTLEVATGAQIKSMIKEVVPSFDTSQDLFLEGHGHHQDEQIGDGQPVSLEVGEGHPVKSFYGKPPTNFGA